MKTANARIDGECSVTDLRRTRALIQCTGGLAKTVNAIRIDTVEGLQDGK